MKLTRRQESFLRHILDLYHEVSKPMRYAEVAERIGVSRFTAYDMLRLLEEKGLVSSDYQLAADKSGPGRSEVVFLPTERARRLLQELGGEAAEANWEEWREQLLGRVDNLGDNAEWADVVEELLARLSVEEDEQIRYCAEVISVIVLRLNRLAGRKILLEFMPWMLPSTNVDIAASQGWNLLGGFALGILVQENAHDHAWCKELIEHVQHCGDLIMGMTPEQRMHLSSMINGVYTSFQAQAQAQSSDQAY